VSGELDLIHDILARCFSNTYAIISTAALPHAGGAPFRQMSVPPYSPTFNIQPRGIA